MYTSRKPGKWCDGASFLCGYVPYTDIYKDREFPGSLFSPVGEGGKGGCTILSRRNFSTFPAF